jgi:hypothetical protein
MEEVPRRRILRYLGAASTTSLAGCSDYTDGITERVENGSGNGSGKSVTTHSDKLVADDGDAEDHFGETISLVGDTVIIGAPGEKNGSGIKVGAAYVFKKGENGWSQQAKLTHRDNNTEQDAFASAVAFDGDTLVVGNPVDKDPYGAGAGSAFVYQRDGDSWKRITKLLTEEPGKYNMFGFSVAIDGDTILVGAIADQEPNGRESGSAYVFKRDQATWNQQTKLVPDDGDKDDKFGHTVSLSGETALIGAKTDEDPNGHRSGAAYVFERQGTEWQQLDKLAPREGNQRALFGDSVAIAGDTVLVGASTEKDPNGAQAGSAYTFQRDDDTWHQEAKLAPDDVDKGDRFGKAVALNENLALVGVYSDDDPNGTNSGSAYLFQRKEGDWHYQEKLVPGDGDAENYFGKSVALSENVAIVGADSDEGPKRENVGSVYVFDV